MTPVPVMTRVGIQTTDGEAVGDVWAWTKDPQSDESRGRIWRVTHLPSGRACIKPTTKKMARRVARALERECSGSSWKTPNINEVPTAELLAARAVVEGFDVTLSGPADDLRPREYTP